MKQIRLAVIGTGMAWNRLHWPAIQELGDRYKIVALCNRTGEKAEEFAGQINLPSENVYTDYRKMLRRDDIDAVDLLVPIHDNFEIAEEIVRRNNNLIAEKPLAGSLTGAKKLLELHKKHPVNIMVAENYRYNEENNKIRELINNNEIGETVYFIKNKVFDFEKEMKKDTYAAREWRQHPEYKGGAFLDAALHDIAAFRHIFGQIDHVYALGRPQQEDFNPYMSVNSQLLFKNGIIGHYSYFPDGKESQKPPIGFRIFGTEGEIFLEERRCGIINITYPDGSSEQIEYTPERGYYNEFLNFYNSLIGKENISVTPEIEYGDIKTVFDILESVKTGQPVKVDNFRAVKS